MAYPLNSRPPSPGQVLSEAIINTQQNLGLTQKELAEIIHTSESTISRWKHGRELEPSSAEGHNALLFIRVYRSLDTLIGGDDAQAREWLQSENKHLHEKPIKLLLTTEGLVRVLNYLDAMRGLA